MTKVIGLWSPPRALSTAFVRMMIERGDVIVVHEPFSNLEAVGEFAVGERTARSYDELVDALFDAAQDRPVFFKDTTEYRYAALLDDRRILHDAVNTFLVRDPRRSIPSHYAINPNVTLEEIGFGHLVEIFDAVRETTGRVPLVMDAQDLVARPHELVEAYCGAVGLPFLPDALTWQPGERPEWARTDHWHRDVDASTGFAERPKEYAVNCDNDERLAGYLRHHAPIYERLRELRLKA